jgi:hypothetical protein
MHTGKRTSSVECQRTAYNGMKRDTAEGSGQPDILTVTEADEYLRISPTQLYGFD